MNLEIESLIDFALADGILTDKKKEVILKKAESLGINKDEIELIINAKLYIKKQYNHLDSTSKSTQNLKEGLIIKCPSCGEPVPSFTTNCKSCGHEFRGASPNKLIKSLEERLKKIETNEWNTNPYNGTNGNIRLDHMVNNSIADKQIAIISSFPIPNTKEDILEFLSLALPQGAKKYSWTEKFTNAAAVKLSKAYKAKAQQCVIKARIAFINDRDLLNQINIYAQQLGIK